MHAHNGIRTWKWVAALFIACLCLLDPCFAEDYSAPGKYFILSGLTGFEDFQDTGTDDIKEAWGLELRVGSRFNKYLAAEADFGMITGFDATIDLSKVNPSLSGTDKVVLDLWSLTANLKAHYPLGRLDPYALAGAGVMYSRIRTAYQTGYT